MKTALLQAHQVVSDMNSANYLRTTDIISFLEARDRKLRGVHTEINVKYGVEVKIQKIYPNLLHR